MPALAALIPALFGALATFLAKLFVARVAIRLAAVTLIAGLGTSLLIGFNTVVAPLIASAFSTSYGQFLGLLFPPVAGTCIAAITAVWASCQTYALSKRAIMLTAGI